MGILSNVWFVIAAIAAFTLCFAHGLNGQRAFVAPLRRTQLFTSPQWGDEDMSWRIFAVTWHMLTVVFGCSGVALLLLATGVIEGKLLPLTITVLYAAFIVLGMAIVGPRVPVTLRRPYANMVLMSQMTVCVASWLGTW